MDKSRSTPVPERIPLRRWVRSLSSALAVALAFVVGDLVAAFVPGAAFGFDSATAGARAGMARLLSPAALAGIGVGLVIVLGLLLVWLAGKPLSRGYLIPASALCLGAVVAGLQPVGREIQLERGQLAHEKEVSSLRGELGETKSKLRTAEADAARVGGLEKQLEAQEKSAQDAAEAASKQLAAKDEALARQLAAKDDGMRKAVSALEEKLQEQTKRAQEAQAERDKAIAAADRIRKDAETERKAWEDTVGALRKEVEVLKKKLAEKK